MRGVAGSGNDQASIGVNGAWRYRTTNYDVAHPGGAAAVYDVYAIASAGIYGANDTDTTDYNWYLQIKSSGATPTGNTPNAQAIAYYRKVGEIDWDGSKITGLRQMVPGEGDARNPLYPTTPVKDVPAVVVKGASGATTETLIDVLDSAGARKARVKSDGAAEFAGVLTQASAAGTAVLSGKLTADASNRFTLEADGTLVFLDGAGTTKATIDTVTGGLVLYSGAASERIRFNATGIGLFGATPAAQSTGWGAALATNFSGAASKKTLAAGYTMNDLRDVVATLVDALRTNGFLGA